MGEPSFLMRQWHSLRWLLQYISAMHTRTKIIMVTMVLIYFLTHPESLPLFLQERVGPSAEWMLGYWAAFFQTSWLILWGRLAAVVALVYSGIHLRRFQEKRLETHRQKQAVAKNEAFIRKARNDAQDKLAALASKYAAEQEALEEESKRVAAALKATMVSEKAKGAMDEVQLQKRAVQQAELEEEARRVRRDQLELESKMVALRKARQQPNKVAEAAKKEKQSEARGGQQAQVSLAAAAKALAPLSSVQQPSSSAENTAADQKSRYLKMQEDLDIKAQQRAAEQLATSALSSADAADASQPGAALPSTGSAKSLNRLAGSTGIGSTGNMIPLAVAQEAEERQRKWLQDLQQQVDGPELARRAALEEERRLREEQDREYRAALEADMQRKVKFEAERAAAEAVAAAAASEAAAAAAAAASSEAEAVAKEEKHRLSKAERRAALPAAPADSTPGTLAVRVRLPDGSTATRRFYSGSPVSEVYAWAEVLEEFPPLWDRDNYRLVTSFPKTTPDLDSSLAEVAEGSGAIALLVEGV